jgi:hypothetical protein
VTKNFFQIFNTKKWPKSSFKVLTLKTHKIFFQTFNTEKQLLKKLYLSQMNFPPAVVDTFLRTSDFSACGGKTRWGVSPHEKITLWEPPQRIIAPLLVKTRVFFSKRGVIILLFQVCDFQWNHNSIFQQNLKLFTVSFYFLKNIKLTSLCLFSRRFSKDNLKQKKY